MTVHHHNITPSNNICVPQAIAKRKNIKCIFLGYILNKNIPTENNARGIYQL